MDRTPLRLIPAVGLTSMSMVAYQLHLSHFLSLVQWHHFAFMVISVALLGLGAGGTLLAIFRSWFLVRSGFLLPFLMILSGLLLSVAIRISRIPAIRFDSYRLFIDPEQALHLLATYLLFFLPFLAGGLAIGLVYVKYTTQTGKYYFADLLGAGLGGPLAILLFWNVQPIAISSLIALLPLVAGLFLLRKVHLRWYLPLMASVLFSILYNQQVPFNPHHSEYKSMSQAMQLPEVEVIAEQNSPYGLVQALYAPTMRYGPGLSVSFTGEVPQNHTVYNNADWFGVVILFSRQDTSHILDYTTSGLPYHLSSPYSVLIPRSSTGVLIAQAVTKKASRIVGLEPHGAVTDLMKYQYVEMTDSLFFLPEVENVGIAPRTFLSRSELKFDLIQVPVIGAFGGTVGLQAMEEETLLTLEGFREMWDALQPEGMLCLSSWLDYPVRYPYKLVTTIAQGLKEAGIENPGRHIICIKSWGTITYCIKKAPFTATEISKARQFTEDLGFDPVLFPDMAFPASDTVNNDQMGESLVRTIHRIIGRDYQQVLDTYRFHIAPATDNRPYFSQFLKWDHFPEYRHQMAERSSAFLELGYFIVLITLVQVLVLAVLLIVLPLFKLGWRGSHKSWALVYFGGLGIGYLFFEIVLIKHFTVYLGHPVYAMAFVISALLISSGLGSLYSSRFQPTLRMIIGLSVIICAGIVLFGLLSSLFIRVALSFDMSFRLILAFLFMAVPAFGMGMAFPMGLRYLSHENPSLVPWAWGINGCTSVISTALATIIAVEAGFLALMLLAAACYAMVCGATLAVSLRK